MLLPLLMTTIAGLSTGLGGLIAALFQPTPRLMAFCGGFAGAVMLTVSLADLAPALLDFYGALLSPLAVGLRLRHCCWVVCWQPGCWPVLCRTRIHWPTVLAPAPRALPCGLRW